MPSPRSAPPSGSLTPALRPTPRRLFSLTGVVPLGAFLLVHLVFNESALGGSLAFAKTVGRVHRVPVLALFETLLVFLPLAVHAGMGLWLMASRKSVASPSPYPLPLVWAMRGTGVLVLAFLLMHLPELRFRVHGPRLDGGELATILASDLSSTSHGVPWRGVAYLFGTGCVVFHFAVGLWGFFAASPRGLAHAAGRRYGAWAAAIFGALLWIAFAEIVVFHATGARLVEREASASGLAPAACP